MKWQTQHRELLAELKRRVTAMIRRASSDQKDYARSLGKYEGAILLNREEQKMAFLPAGHEALQRQCRGIHQLLKGPEGDLSAVFADELETIRKYK